MAHFAVVWTLPQNNSEGVPLYTYSAAITGQQNYAQAVFVEMRFFKFVFEAEICCMKINLPM